MRNIFAAAFMFVASHCDGAYFRYIGGPGYQRQILNEACFNPRAGLSATTACTSVPIVTHSEKDGFLLIPGESWAPLTIGGAFGSTRPLLTFGPAANLTPTMKMFLLSMLNRSAPDSFANLKSLLAPNPVSKGPDVTMNLGAKWGVFPLEHAAMRNSIFILSAGPALLF